MPWLGRNHPSLEDVAPVSGEPVSVIVPARNEAATIQTVVRSILASTYADLELLVVDDRSSDATAALVQALAAEDSRLRLVRGAELPDGWYGKTWACFQGYQSARYNTLLFTDADTRHAPELLARAVGALVRRPRDLVTVAPHQRCETFWERLVMPQIWLLLGIRYHPDRVSHARRERDVIANGQFILVTRPAYEAVGTHAVVRHEVAEDLALAQAFFRAGRSIYFAFAHRLMETRMYSSLTQIIEGWSKNVYLGGRRSFPNEPLLRSLVPLMLVIAMLFWLVPPVMLGVTRGAGALGQAALAATGLSALFWMLISYGMRIPILYGLGYPLGALVTLYIAARSTWRGSRQVEWRGRTYGKRETGNSKQ